MKTTRRVRFSETDASGRVHFTSILKWAEDVEHQALAAVGLPVFSSSASDSGWPRVRVHCDYRAPISFEQEVELEISIESLGKSSLTWRFQVRNLSEEGQLAAEGQLVTVFLSEGKTAELDDDFRRALAVYQ